ncbi:MAG: hypothetical protein QOG31_847 [Thermoplasmata archaeon]|jgi:hypothetical protein|nr:hypothetical protein [Thermoplasmata archaeon]
MSFRALVSLLAVAALLSGCTSPKPHSLSEGSMSLGLLAHPNAPPVNLTAAEIHQFPPVETLIAQWDAGHPPGAPEAGGSVSIPFPYEEGLAIVHAIQTKRPGVAWPEANMVPINHGGKILGLLADGIHT